MRDNISDIQAMYDADPHRETDRLTRHQLEYDLTLRYLSQYLPATGHVLELGPGPGPYTIELARRGYRVTAQDLSQSMLEILRERLAQESLSDQVRLVQGDARDLAALADETFDAALIMGPLYHLIYESDRRLVLQQVFDRLRPRMPVFSAFISRYGIWGRILQKEPSQIYEEADHASVLERGYDPPRAAGAGNHFRGYFATSQELAPLHESIGFKTLVVAGVEPAIGAEDAIYNALSGDIREKWLNLLYRISAEPSIVGASRHMLYVGRKPE